MSMRRVFFVGITAIAVAVVFVVSPTGITARQTNSDIKIDPDDIGGVVTSTKGPEGGVWVIAETTDLPTRFIKIVVTDDRGRYVLPDLPKANYRSEERRVGKEWRSRVWREN